MIERTIIEPETLQEVSGFVVSEPTRIVFRNPRRGGPRLADVRSVLGKRGRARFSCTPMSTFVDLDPGEPDAVVTLDMIARNDAAGLERAILSALHTVDFVVVGVDGRSDAATREIAEAYADIVHVFHAADIELTDEEWNADKIHFANARNIGRAKVPTPWVLVLDTDEYLKDAASDLRDKLRAAPADVDAYTLGVDMSAQAAEVVEDTQRLTRAKCRWWRATHNQLDGGLPSREVLGCLVHDPSIRAEDETMRRFQQRNAAIEDLAQEGTKGEINALFHAAKHKLLSTAYDFEEGIKLANDFRSKLEPHGPAAEERAMIAFTVASRYYTVVEDLDQAEVWALRALLDGPRPEVFCMLGDIAEDRGDLKEALAWYEAACVVPAVSKFKWNVAIGMRFSRREGLRRALAAEKVDESAASP